ncbi:MAG: aminoglycoside phosphotransferase family protein [Phycisphaerales bacterium]|nr:aminoglycoside phosphotransferase family protein [Phycisphaerales bacterium]
MLNNAPDIPVDPTLGVLAGAFDPREVLEACRRDLHRVESSVRERWRDCRFLEAFYHPQRYLRAAFVLLSESDTPPNRYWPEATIVYLHTPVRRPISARGTILRVSGIQVEAYVFPNDRRLRAVRKFQSREAALAAWTRWIASGGHAFSIDADSLRRAMIRYVPEKRWVLRLRCRGTDNHGRPGKRSIAVRCTLPSQSADIARLHRDISQAAHAHGGVRVPQLAGHDADSGIVATEWVRGDDLASLLANDASDDVMHMAASAIRQFHQLPVAVRCEFAIGDLQRAVIEATDDLAAAAPELGVDLASLREQLVSAGSRIPTMQYTALLHNDLHPRQFRVNGDGIALLDLDRVCRGPAIVDIANFAAQVEAMGDRGDSVLDAINAKRLASAFLRHYESLESAPLDEFHLRHHMAVANLNLARGMMRHLKSGWRSLTESCVRRALEYSAHNTAPSFPVAIAGEIP